MPDPIIKSSEYAQRRARVRTALKGAVALVHAGQNDAHLPTPWRPDPNFEYLTGLADEPGAVLMLDPKNPVAERREMLFLRPLNPEVERWDGERMGISAALRTAIGMKAVFRLGHLPRFLNDAARRSGTLACLHAPSTYEQPVTPDLAIFRKVCERVPGMTITERGDVVPRLRSVKSTAEVRMISRAIDITAAGFDAVMRTLRPGQNEFDVQETLEHAYRTNGSRGPAFGSIIGAGRHSTVLHYAANDTDIVKGDLICLDSGAAYGAYGADVTRTIPASGKYTKRQREIYDIVLAAEMAAIRAVKPGVRISAIDRAARTIIARAGHADAFVHGIGHHLGVETHDAAPDEPLPVGAVITIEPGIYLPDEAIGVRIEDDVVVTKTGARVLSSSIPKKADEIEAIMAKGRRR